MIFAAYLIRVNDFRFVHRPCGRIDALGPELLAMRVAGVVIGVGPVVPIAVLDENHKGEIFARPFESGGSTTGGSRNRGQGEKALH